MIKKVMFKNSSDVIIASLHHIPKKNSKKGIIICHGMMGNKEGTKCQYFAEKFCELGFHVLRFDFRYVGESEGKFSDITVTGEIEDLRGAYEYLTRQGIKSINIIGSSLGGTVSLIFASQNHCTIDKLVTISAPVKLEQLMNTWFTPAQLMFFKTKGHISIDSQKLNWTFVEDAYKYDADQIIKNVKCPILVIHGDDDPVVSHDNADYIFNNINSDKKIVKIPGGDHRLGEHLEILFSNIKNFII